MEHVNSSNYYRKHLPNIFTGEVQADSSTILKDKLKMLEPVPLPAEVRKAKEHASVLKLNNSLKASGSQRNLDLGTM